MQTRYNVAIIEKVYEEIKGVAKKRGQTVSKVVHEALEDMIKKESKKK